jgi:H+-transporting ATPase
MEPNVKDNLQSLPMRGFQAYLESSPGGHSQAEAEKRVTQYGLKGIEEQEGNPSLKMLAWFWRPISWVVEAAVILSAVVRHRPALFIIPVYTTKRQAMYYSRDTSFSSRRNWDTRLSE